MKRVSQPVLLSGQTLRCPNRMVNVRPFTPGVSKTSSARVHAVRGRRTPSAARAHNEDGAKHASVAPMVIGYDDANGYSDSERDWSSTRNAADNTLPTTHNGSRLYEATAPTSSPDAVTPRSRVFGAMFRRRSSVPFNPIVILFDFPDVRNRFFMEASWPTIITCVIGCVAWACKAYLGFHGISMIGHNVVAGLLGFLIAFIANTNYTRWIAARSSFAHIVIACFDLASKTASYMCDKGDAGLKVRREMARLLRMLFTALVITITDTSMWGGSSTESDAETSIEARKRQEVQELLMRDAQPNERRMLLQAGPRDAPFIVIELLRTMINSDDSLRAFAGGSLSAQFLAVNQYENVRGSVDGLWPKIGDCMTLALTPVPSAARFIFGLLQSVLVLTFPFALISELSWETPIVSAFIAFAYYGLNALSSELTNPFRVGDTGPRVFACDAKWLRDVHSEISASLMAPRGSRAAGIVNEF